MVKQVSTSANVNNNLFDIQHLTSGWINETEENPLPAFYTSDFIEVIGGDEIYFGAAITTQWWHLVAYNQMKQPLHRGMLGTGVFFHQHLDENTAIMLYRVADDVHYVRMICDARYVNIYMVTKNQPFSAEEYRASMIASNAKPLNHIEKFVKDGWTTILNISGSGILTIGNQKFDYGPQSLIVIPPEVLFVKDSEEGFVDIHICSSEFSPSTVTGSHVIVTTDDNNRSIETLARLMLRLYWDSAMHNSQLLEQTFGLAEQFISHRLEMDQPQYSCVTHLYNTLLLKFSDPNFSLESVLTQEHYCPNHVRRLFKKRIGCSPMEYLMELRIRRAKDLLLENKKFKKNISQIAMMSGFPDQYYFSKVFKQRVGCSPREFMKEKNK